VPAIQMKDVVAPGTFLWNTARKVVIHLSNLPVDVIRISSEDGSELYLKTMNDGTQDEQDLSIILPSSVARLMINEFPADIISDKVDFTFPRSIKSMLVTNYSMNFNGTTAWIKMPNSTNLTFTNQYSVSAWVKASKQQTAKIIQKGDWDGLGLGQDLWNGWQTSVAFSDGTSSLINWNSGLPVINQWYYLVGTYDGTTLKIYVDGVLKNSVTVSKNIRLNGRFISIGSDAGNQKFFQGLLDEVSLWNVALTSSQITTGRTTGFTGGEAGIKGYWKFNEGTGSISADLSPDQYTGNNNNTLYNTDVGYNQTVDTDQDGVPDSYDDYPQDNLRAFNNFITSSGYNTLVFEDLWPGQGDYDFNDMVIGYQVNTITSAQNKIVETKATFVIRAIGGSFRSGFGFNLPGCTVPASAFTSTGSVLHEGYVTLLSNGLEAQQSKPTIIVFDNAYWLMPGQSGVLGVNVQQGVAFVNPDTVRIHINYPANTYTLSQLDINSFNPFIMVNKTRGREVHLPDNPPTSLADLTYFGTSGDDSQPSSHRYYKTKNNLPWAMNIPGSFDYPVEKHDILGAYLKLATWAESGGNQYIDWYQNISGYRNTSAIFQH
ncbi:MAG: LruC domain-containing protein, partial [Bacteroidota bacterium]